MNSDGVLTKNLMNGRQRLYYNIYIPTIIYYYTPWLWFIQNIFLFSHRDRRGFGPERIAGYSVYNDRQDSLGPGTLIGSAPLYTPLVTPSNRVANSRQIAR